MEIRDTELKKIVDFVKGTPKAERIYDRVIKDFLHQRYKDDQITAITLNHLGNPNEKHTKEMNDLQAYREECKAEAKRLLGIE